MVRLSGIEEEGLHPAFVEALELFNGELDRFEHEQRLADADEQRKRAKSPGK